jgi:uncharacterized protein (DUF1330 family)
MAKAYALLQFNIIDHALFGSYVKSAYPTILTHHGQVIVAAENPDPQEGSLTTSRTTIIEFPSKEDAMNWYNSTEYNAIKHLRHDATNHGTFVVLDAWQRPHGGAIKN